MVAVPDLAVEVLRVGEGPEDHGLARVAPRPSTPPGGSGAWIARGERVDVPAVSVYRVRDGLIAEEAEYIDPAVMMTPPGSAGRRRHRRAVARSPYSRGSVEKLG